MVIGICDCRKLGEERVYLRYKPSIQWKQNT